jgi:hypothetical protein
MLNIPLYSPLSDIALSMHSSRIWERKLLEATNTLIPHGVIIEAGTSPEGIETIIRELIKTHSDIKEWKITLESTYHPTEAYFTKLNYPEIRISKGTDKEFGSKPIVTLGKKGGVILAIPPGNNFRTSRIIINIDPENECLLLGGVDILTTWERKHVGYLIPQQAFPPKTSREIMECIRKRLFGQRLYGVFEIQLLTFENNHCRISWCDRIMPQSSLGHTVLSFTLAALGSTYEEGSIVFDHINSTKLKLRYIQKIPFMNTKRVDDNNSTATSTNIVENVDITKSVVYIPGLQHGGFLNMGLDTIIAICHDSGMNFDFSLKKGTLFPRLEQPVAMITVADDMETSIEKLLWNLMVLNQRVKEKEDVSYNFQEIAAALAEELQLQRSRPIGRRNPKDRRAPCWDKTTYEEIAQVLQAAKPPPPARSRRASKIRSKRPSVSESARISVVDSEDGEFLEEYVFEPEPESDLDSDDSQNELNDLREELKGSEERNELDEYLETYTEIPNYTDLRMNWTLINAKIDSERVLSQLKTAKLITRSIPTKQLRMYSDFLQEDNTQFLTIVPDRVRIKAGKTDQQYVEFMEREVDKQNDEVAAEVQRAIQKVEDDEEALEDLKSVFSKVLNALRVHFRQVCAITYRVD